MELALHCVWPSVSPVWKITHHTATLENSAPLTPVQSPESSLQFEGVSESAPVSASQRQPLICYSPSCHLLCSPRAQSTRCPAASLDCTSLRVSVDSRSPPPPSRSSRPRVCPYFCLAHDFRRLLWVFFFFAAEQDARLSNRR